MTTPTPSPAAQTRSPASSRTPEAAASRAGSPEAEPLVRVEGLCRRYGKLEAVRDVSFSVARGEVVGFLGPNGAGKSTTLRTIVGYLAPTAGRVAVQGHDVVEEPELARRAIGYMPETAPLYPEMRVLEYLRFRAQLKRVERRRVEDAVTDVMKKAAVSEVSRMLCGALSRGFRQRVALADALLGDPPLLILDEPTAGLDPNQIRSVRSLLGRLAGDHTILLSTHILSEVESTCTRAVVIDRGRVVAEGPIRELRRRGSQRAVVSARDPGRRAYGILLAEEGVLGVTASTPTQSVPPSSSRPGASGEWDRVESFELTFDSGRDPVRCLEELLLKLAAAKVRVHEARLVQSSLEEVFSQLTGGSSDDA